MFNWIRKGGLQAELTLALAVAAALIASSPIAAQNQIMKGSLTGEITDQQGLAIPGATVDVSFADGGRTWSLKTGAAGEYQLYGLDPGVYRVTAGLEGFEDFHGADLTLRPGQDLSLAIRLVPAGVAEQVTVTASLEDRRTDYPSPANYITAEQIASLNTPTVEDVLKYQPGVVVRRRYIGDTNGTLGMRGSNMFQTSRAMVFADGVPLHNPLQTRWNGAPRWSLIAPDEVESVEVVYGPFSSEYSGNAMGGVVKYKTRMPEKRRLRIDGNLFGQTYAFGGADDRLGGGRSTVSYGDRIGKFSFSILENHLQNASQPQNFALDSTNFGAPSGQPEVGGAERTVNYRNVPSILYGNEGRDQVRTDLLKAKLGHDHTENWRSRWTVAYENRSDRNRHAVNYLRDGSGGTIWGDGDNATKDAVFDGAAFNVDNSFFGVSNRTRESAFFAWDLEGRINDDWMFEATASNFRILDDKAADSFFNPADPLDDGAGTLTIYDDTRWTTFDLKLRDLDFLSNPQLSFVAGYHFSMQSIGVAQYQSLDYADWTRDIEASNSGGRTSIQAAFAQLGWRPQADWEITLGGRGELWRSREGFARNSSLDLTHPDRDISRFSPKASIGWEPAGRLRVQYSVGKAYRFPVVEELFDNQIRTYGTVLSDASLEPEAGLHHNVGVQQGLGYGHVEVNYFRDDVDNTIFTQFQFIQGRSVFSFLPIDKVVTNGVELVLNQPRFLDSPLDLQINTTYADSTIVEHSLQASIEGNVFPRMPKLRMGLFGIYHITARWLASVGVRYSSNQFGDLDNLDTARGVYGAIDAYTFVDCKVSHDLPIGGRLSFGVDNLGNDHAFVYHPWPGRTFYAEYTVDVLDQLFGRER